jgi:nitroreductase
MHAERTDPRAAIRPLLRTRQVREFSDEPVDRAALDALADVARWSGSSKNNQPWRFIVVTDRDMIRRLADSGMPYTRALQTAAAAIAITLPEQPGWKISHAFDEGRAAERILIAAGLLGLGAGIAWVSSDGRATVADALGLPEDRFVRTIVAIGLPTPAAARPKSEPGAARLPRSETVIDERWEDR